MSDDEQKQSMVAKIVGAGVALGAAWLVQKIIEAYEIYDKKNPIQAEVKKAPPKRYKKG